MTKIKVATAQINTWRWALRLKNQQRTQRLVTKLNQLNNVKLTLHTTNSAAISSAIFLMMSRTSTIKETTSLIKLQPRPVKTVSKGSEHYLWLLLMTSKNRIWMMIPLLARALAHPCKELKARIQVALRIIRLAAFCSTFFTLCSSQETCMLLSNYSKMPSMSQ